MGKLLKTIVPLIILAGGILIGAWFFINPDEARKRPAPEINALLVEIGQAEQGDYTAMVEAMGQVIPAMEIDLKAQVSGEIIDTEEEFMPGGNFEKGATILTVDPADYELLVKKQQAIVKQAQADYALEMGRQSVAKDELKIIERTTGRKPESPALALRRPQLTQAEAELEKVQSDLDTAQLGLKRTVITAPFNALVRMRDVALGDKVSSGETLATLVNTDEYWIEIAIPVSDLQWLDVPHKGSDMRSDARIVLDGNRGERQGVLLKLTGSLDAQSRLATALIAVPDPLVEDAESSAPSLILGDYARVVLAGRALDNVTRIPLAWVRDGNVVWVKDNQKLVYKTVDIVFEDRDYAYIANGLNPDDAIVTSDIAVSVENMTIRTQEEARSAVMEKMKSSKGVE